MSEVDWSKAPDGAQYHMRGTEPNWYKVGPDLVEYWDSLSSEWVVSDYRNPDELHSTTITLTPRPDFVPFTSIEDAQPKREPYTREEALRFLVAQLESWPTDITGAPLCPGWGWERHANSSEFVSEDGRNGVEVDEWREARPDFVTFVSVEDAQPAIDMVNHPPHYQSDNGIECIDAIRAALGRDGFIAYCIGNSMKYQWREKADKLEDMRKAAWYLNRAIEEQSK